MSSFDAMFSLGSQVVMSTHGDRESIVYVDQTRKISDLTAVWVLESTQNQEDEQGVIRVEHGRIHVSRECLPDPVLTGAIWFRGVGWNITDIEDQSENMITLRISRTKVIEKTHSGFRR